MYKNRQHSTEAECRLFCCPILLSRCRFCNFLKLLSYQHTANARPLSEFVQNFGFAHFKNQNRKRRKTAWNKGLTAKFLFWNARWPEKRKRLLKRLSAWYNEGYKKDVRILCVADCRQKAILPPKGANSPFRKWKNSWISWFCYLILILVKMA